VSVLSSVQCFDIVGWLSKGPSGPLKASTTSQMSHLRARERRKTEVEPADPGSRGKMTVKTDVVTD